MNERDRVAVAAPLVARGYSLAPSELTADVILLRSVLAPSTFYKTMTSALRPRGTLC